MGLYPDQGSVMHPDDVGERRMPPRMTHVAGNLDEDTANIPSAVRYGAGTEASDEVISLGRDLGTALKVMKQHRAKFPDSPARMRATYD